MSRVIEINGDLDEQLNKAKSPLCVVDFYATWCGPCRQLHPRFDEMSQRYTDVSFFRVDSDQNKNISSANGIRALPTIFFYLNGSHVDTIQGYNPEGIENKIIELRSQIPSSFGGKGISVGSSTNVPAFTNEEIRQARLKKFEQAQKILLQKKAELERKKQLQKKEEEEYSIPSSMEVEEEKPAVVTNLTSDYTTVFNQLLDMGFDEQKIKITLESCGANLESAISYLSTLQEKEEQNKEKQEEDENMEVVCDGNTCKLVKKNEDINMSPLPTTTSDNSNTITAKNEAKSFEERQKEVRELIEKKKKEKQEKEKMENLEKEKKRREEGKMITNQLDTYEKMLRQREMEERKKQQQQDKLEKDRQLRLWQEEHGVAVTPVASSSQTTTKTVTIEDKVDSLINCLKEQRVNQIGRIALRTLSTIFTNSLKEEEKYHSIKSTNKVFVEKILPATGASNLLLLGGFENINGVYTVQNPNSDLIHMIIAKIDMCLKYP